MPTPQKKLVDDDRAKTDGLLDLREAAAQGGDGITNGKTRSARRRAASWRRPPPERRGSQTHLPILTNLQRWRRAFAQPLIPVGNHHNGLQKPQISSSLTERVAQYCSFVMTSTSSKERQSRTSARLALICPLLFARAVTTT